MPRLHLAITLASTLGLASACEASKTETSKTDSSKPETSKPEASKPEAGEAKAASLEAPAASEASHAPAPVEPQGPTDAGERSAPPPWFDASKIEHVAVTKQVASRGRIAGGYASAMVLELTPGTSPEDCVGMARELIGQSVEDVPEASPSGEGRLMLQGEASDSGVAYHYTIVCGDAKGKPSMYLSYTAKR